MQRKTILTNEGRNTPKMPSTIIRSSWSPGLFVNIKPANKTYGQRPPGNEEKIRVHWGANTGNVTQCTLKTPGSDLTRKRVPWSQTHSWVRLIWNPDKNDRNLSPKCLSDSDSGSVWPGFRVGLTPKWVWPPWTLFRVKSDPGVFRVWHAMARKSTRPAVLFSRTAASARVGTRGHACIVFPWSLNTRKIKALGMRLMLNGHPLYMSQS